MNIAEILKERVLILDGAIGTMIQDCKLTEEQFRGERFCNSKYEQRGNNDILSLTQPQIIADIHAQYLDAGADIISTNTFNSTTVSMSDYGVEEYVSDINRAAAQLAVKVAKRYSTPQKPRFVAGSIGPTNKSCTISPNVNNPAYRAITYNQLVEAYQQQIEALIDGGVDILLMETVFDTLNAKCALAAAEQAFKSKDTRLPIMLSITVSDKSGRVLSGQTLEAIVATLSDAPLLSIGINCSFGARDILPILRQLSAISTHYISVHPNAGLPNRFGEYDETPQTMLQEVTPYLTESLVNIIGGCCGTTPQHISLYNTPVEQAKPFTPHAKGNKLQLAGLEPLTITAENNFVNIGERCNVAGSRKFLRLIKEHSYDEALQIARQQVENGAQIIDINMDDAMLETEQEMVTFLNLVASEPDICRVPLMIDSSKWSVIESSLKCVQGRPIVNSISLKEGEDIFIEHAQKIKQYGAAVVVMAFDERGQADTYQRKIDICSRAYNILTKTVGIEPQNIIFDPNILAVATGIAEHRDYALNFIEATRWIKENLPYAKVSGGVSNLSFSFRGNNYIREAMHAVFLYHAIKGGMDMGIVNPATAITYNDIPKDILEVIEDVILNRTDDADEKLIEVASTVQSSSMQPLKDTASSSSNEPQTVEELLQHALIKGVSDNLQTYIAEALTKYDNPLSIIETPLMDGMKCVGELFGDGKMFLPQVVKSARTMKQAVEILKPYIEEHQQSAKQQSAGKIVLATVKGDVHDIGKNIVSVILSCNNYEVIDLGVMVSADKIIETAVAEKADIIGVSGLITPSLEEMCNIVTLLEREGLQIPIFIGGATTSPQHTAVKIAPLYSGVVIHVKDASQNPLVAAKLLNPSERDGYIAEVKREQERLRETIKPLDLVSFEYANAHKPAIDWSSFNPTTPTKLSQAVDITFTISELTEYINWIPFFSLWRIGGKYASISQQKGCDHCKATWLTTFAPNEREKAAQAMQLYKEAERLLLELSKSNEYTVNASVAIYPANTDKHTIEIYAEGKTVEIPTLRQQLRQDEDVYYSLADFIAPKESGKTDHIGAFAVAVSQSFGYLIDAARGADNQYRVLLIQSLADRLAEAAASLLHHRVRRDIWGFAPEEETISNVLSPNTVGIRPAIGYPSLPDQSLIFNMKDLLSYSNVGIEITENGAMNPSASITGLIFSSPHSKYFTIKVDNEQRGRYIQKRGFAQNNGDKWLSV